MGYEEGVEDKEIDAVSFGTPNHWHALGTIWPARLENMFMSKNLHHTLCGKDAKW